MKLSAGDKEIVLSEDATSSYLSKIFGPSRLVTIEKLGEGFHNAAFLVKFRQGTDEKRVIMRIVRSDIGWGHDYLGDRAAVLLLQHELFRSSPRSCRSIDVGALLPRGEIVSVGDAIEFVHLTEEVTERDARPYVDDFFRIAKTKELEERDRARCKSAAKYLVELHSTKKSNPYLYKRHIRDLVGHGEMVMGVIDSYPDPETLDFTSRRQLAEIEAKVVNWRNRIKFLAHRLSRIHGDYHPFGNIRFRTDDSILAMDQSRQAFGEPADDVTCLSINYIFFSIWHHGEFRKPFSELFHIFMREYLEGTGDEELLRVVAPFYAFRGLVVLHPVYYPDMDSAKRLMMINFIRNVLDSDNFDLKSVSSYLSP